MNGRKAKRLRAEAQRLSVGEPWERYKTRKRAGKNKDGDVVETYSGQVRLVETCGKAIYRELKRGQRHVA